MTVMNVRRPRPPARLRLISGAGLAGALALGLVALSGCGAPGKGTADIVDGRSGGKLAVTASFYPLRYLVQQIGGDHVSVTTLTPPGVEPHDLELKPREITRLGESGLVVYLKGIAPAVDDAVKVSDAKNVLDAAPLGSPRKNDPHIWLDPVRFGEIAEGVGAALAKTDPGHAADYAKNTAALTGRLGALDTAYRQGLAHTATRTFITTHAAFGYLAQRYGLRQEAIVGIDPESEPSPARVKDLGDVAARDHVGTVFFETLVSDKLAKTIAGNSGLRTDVLDPVEGITDQSKGADYIAVMRSNLVALRTALGAK